jgi:uncharacterized protein YjbI with pentapeptide repeats
LVILTKTACRETKFKDCKMIGVNFEHCNKFGLSFSFENCILNHSSFYQTKIKNTHFKNSQLLETDFAACDLTGSLFDDCDLLGAAFEKTIVEHVDFRTAFNYSIDMENNRVKKAKFSLKGIAGLLNKYDIVIENT